MKTEAFELVEFLILVIARVGRDGQYYSNQSKEVFSYLLGSFDGEFAPPSPRDVLTAEKLVKYVTGSEFPVDNPLLRRIKDAYSTGEVTMTSKNLIGSSVTILDGYNLTPERPKTIKVSKGTRTVCGVVTAKRGDKVLSRSALNPKTLNIRVRDPEGFDCWGPAPHEINGGAVELGDLVRFQAEMMPKEPGFAFFRNASGWKLEKRGDV